jgi:peptidyl-prolyl cis-trans isomerase D
MALIGKIREKSWLLIAVVGIAMIAFIIPEINLSGGAQVDQYGIGTINGEMLDDKEYDNLLQNARYQTYQTKMQQNNGQPIPLDENDEQNAMAQAWNAALANHILKQEYARIGLMVDDIELENILYGQEDFTPSFFSMNFIDSLTGEFSPNQLRQYMESLEQSSDPAAAEQLTTTLRVIRQNRVEEKYNALISKGIHATSLEGKNEYLSQKEVKNVTYTFQNFTKVPQDAIAEITEEEVKTYYEAHKHEKKYEQKPFRKVNYFTIPVTPSGDDTLRVMNQLNGLVDLLKNATNDSLFVLQNSEVKEFSSNVAHPAGTMSANQSQFGYYTPDVASKLEGAEAGDVVGPYANGPFVAISKIVAWKDEPYATVRHILLTASDDDAFTKAQKKADSIVGVIRSKKNFEEMVTLFSEDPGSKNTGGKYENFAQGAMVPTFNDFSFDKPIGSLGTVKTSYGIHIVEVLERNTQKRPVLATVAKTISITKASIDNIAATASSFIYDLDELMQGKTLEEKTQVFDTFAVNNGYVIRSLTFNIENPKAPGFGQMAEGRLLRLAFEDGAKEGMVSPSPIKDNEQVVIAFLAEINETKTPSFVASEARMRAEVRKEKQAQYLIDQMVGQKDLQALSTSLGAQFQTEGITFGASNVAVGREPILIGTAFSGLKDGQTSIPVKGTNGVFVLRVDSTVEAPETTDFSTEQSQLASQTASTVLQRYRNSLIQSSEVIDNRKLRSFGIR